MQFDSPNSSPTGVQRPPALSVSELNRQVKRMLEVSYAQVWVSGEISGLSRPSSGHWYFTLKDERSQIRCAMFRGSNQRLRFAPKEGDEIIVRGKVSLYEGRGDYQLIAEGMEPAGLGQLQAAFEALKMKLSQEGLFEAKHKKPLPLMPKKIAVITSKTGAVIHDILTVAKRRFPATHILLIPVTVQGETAAREVAAAIAKANELSIADALIVGRGGGSLEDLWAFNEEIVARAIFASEIPVVSAVGHEVDTSIADMVADVRAPTPSAAAEFLTPDQFELSQQLDGHLRRLAFLLEHRLEKANTLLNTNASRLQHPGQNLARKAEKAQLLKQQLKQNTKAILMKHTYAVDSEQLKLAQFNPRRLLDQRVQLCEQLLNRLTERHNAMSSNHAHRLTLAAQSLNVVSPLATLDRGYSILRDKDKAVINSTTKVEIGQTIQAMVADGELALEVKSVSPKQAVSQQPLTQQSASQLPTSQQPASQQGDLPF
jgi:exodeoxyribonuclease VII large subunit